MEKFFPQKRETKGNTFRKTIQGEGNHHGKKWDEGQSWSVLMGEAWQSH